MSVSSIHITEPTYERKYWWTGKLLGKGTFCKVYSGTTKDSTKQVAVKLMKKKNLSESDVKSMRDEIAILRDLKHPNIVRLYDFFETDVAYQLVMELMTGGDLFDRLVVKESYDEREARDAARLITDAIRFMHSKGIAHRDLKPENLLLVSKDCDSSVKLGDFGFAKKCDDSANDGQGSLRTSCGTQTYVSPEILRNKPYGTKSDMWSLGVIVFILLSGYPPFTDSDKRALFRKIQKGKFDFHPDYWGGISEEAKEMVKGLLTVDPKKRLSAKELLETEWIHFDANESLASYDVMEPNFAKLKRFNTKRKVRAAVSTVVAINRLTTLATVVGREVVIPTTPQQ